MRLDAPCSSCSTDLVELPASFSRSSLGQAPALEPSTPLARPDPINAWLDLSTVANVVSTFTNLLNLGS